MSDSDRAPVPPTTDGDIAALGYEQARDELVRLATALERGAPLEESLSMWERAEALADHCTRWLDRADQTIDEKTRTRPSPGG